MDCVTTTLHQIEGIIFLTAALIAAFEIPHALHRLWRWLRRRLPLALTSAKQSAFRRVAARVTWTAVIFVTTILVPVHSLALAMEGSEKLCLY